VTTKEVTEAYDKLIEATLAADGEQTILVIEVHGMPLDKIAFYGAGWQIHAENLATYLAGRQRGDTEARWDDLVPPYQNLAANIG
jgi:protoheme ferro-lyase